MTSLTNFWRTTRRITTYEAIDNYSHYFLGSIVISKKDEANKGYIVDGQQRLTTLTLLLINLCRMFDNAQDKLDITNLILSEESGKVFFNLDVPERAQCMKALYEGEGFDDSKGTRFYSQYRRML